MIDLYGMGSPNVTKVALMLEEAGLAYDMHHVSVMRGENHRPDFLALNPVAKVPVIVDRPDGKPAQPVFESGAILIYLAETYAPALLPPGGPGRWEVLEWLTVQVALVGPMLGQHNHFLINPGQAGSYGAERYRDQALRVYQILDARLASRDWLGGDAYSVADIATWPWADYVERHGFAWSDFPALAAWHRRIAERPAAVSALQAMARWQDLDIAMVQGAGDADYDRFFARTTPGPAPDMSPMAR